MKHFKKQLGFVLPLAILIVVVLIVAGVVGYYFYKTSQEQKEAEVPKPEQEIDETADWKTYRNDRYGYEVKYPNNWKVQEGGAPRSPTFSYHWNENIYCQFDIVVTPVDYGGEIAWYKENDYKETKYGIGGISAIRFNKSQVGKNSEPLDAIFFDKNSNYYRISLRTSTNKYEVGCNDVFNQILSTFKFIEKEETVEKQIGYIKNVYEKDGKRYLDIDYVQYLSGEEAIKAMKEDGKCPADIYPDPTQCIPNGYYIRNQNPKIRTFEISKDAEISRTTAFEYSSSGIKIINYNEFKNLFAARDSYFKSTIPFHIEILNDVVVKITEQFIP